MTDQLLPVCITEKRYGPSPLQSTGNEERFFVYRSRKNQSSVDFTLVSTIPQTVPSWAGFRISIASKQTINKTSIGYLDCINAPATDISTVYDIFESCLKIKEALKLKTIVCVLDQAIYCKAMEIKWKDSERYSSCLVMLGIFHTIMFLGVMGKRFAEVGLKDLLTQSGIVAEGLIDTSLCGIQYNRSVRRVKLVYETLSRILLELLHEQYENQWVTIWQFKR